MTFLDDLKYKLEKLNVLEKLIAINIAVFIVFSIPIPFLNTLNTYLSLPSDFLEVVYQPWSIITYSFLHSGPIHIFFNMLWLYFIGQFLLNLFNPKMALNIYFLGAICGGLLYLFAYNVFPQLFTGRARLVGASAAVRALMIFLCVYMPNKEVRFFTFNIKLLYIGVALLVMDVVGLFGGNSGGNIAHLGGALLGFFYAKQLHKGRDIGKGFEKTMNTIFGWFEKSEKKSSMKTVHKKKGSNKMAGYSKNEFKEFNDQKKIDIILDKISKSGYDSLSAAEKEYLFKAGKNK